MIFCPPWRLLELEIHKVLQFQTCAPFSVIETVVWSSFCRETAKSQQTTQTWARCAAVCQNKQSFPAKSFHHRCDLIYSYGVLLSADTITALSNAFIAAILPHKAVLSEQPWSCSAITTLRNFPVLIRINNTLTHLPIPASCPGIVGVCWWGPPGAALTYHRTSHCSRTLPHCQPGIHPHRLRMKLGVKI